MKTSEREALRDIKHHAESIPVLAHNIITRAKKTAFIQINEDVCREIIRLSALILKK